MGDQDFKPSEKSAGWYPISESISTERFWDGRKWTKKIRLKVSFESEKKYSAIQFPYLWKWYLLSLLFLLLVTANVISVIVQPDYFAEKPPGSVSTANEPANTEFPTAVATPITIPEGYVDTGSGVAYVSSPSVDCEPSQFGCTVVELFVYADCPDGIEVYADLFGPDGQPVATTFAKSDPVKPGKKTKVLLSTSLETASTAKANQFFCK